DGTTALGFLAGDPGAPGRRATAAVARGAVGDAIGVDDVALRVEAHGTNAAGARAEFTVAGIDPAAVPGGETGAAVRRAVPGIAAAPDHLVGARDDARRKACWKAQAMGVCRKQRTVVPGFQAAIGGRSERAPDQAGPDGEHAGGKQ